MRVVPTTTGYGFTKDQALRRNADNTAWLNDGMGQHTHIDSSAVNGGEFTEILFANMGNVIDINMMNANAAQYPSVVTGSGGAAFTDQINQTSQSFVKATTGTTNGGLSRFMVYGIIPWFGARSKYQVGMEVTLATNMLFRLGIGGEQVDVANNSLRKYGIEGCSSAPEGTVILVFSADNVTRSTQASTDNIVESGGNSYVVQHSPSLNIKMIKGALSNTTTKASNIPSSSTLSTISGDDFGVMKGGIKTTTASESKDLRIWGQRFVAYEQSGRWAQVPWQ